LRKGRTQGYEAGFREGSRAGYQEGSKIGYAMSQDKDISWPWRRLLFYLHSHLWRGASNPGWE